MSVARQENQLEPICYSRKQKLEYIAFNEIILMGSFKLPFDICSIHIAHCMIL